jgi:hypothetical protein
VPFADGGTAVADNIQLRCRAHNQHESYLWFSAEKPPLVRELRDYSGRLSTRSGPSRQSSYRPLAAPVPPRFSVVSWRLFANAPRSRLVGHIGEPVHDQCD